MYSQETMNEIKQLSKRDQWSISYDREERVVLVEGISLSEQWRPAETAVLLELPDSYPDDPPRAYIEESVRFVGESDPEGDQPAMVAPRSARDDVEWRPFYLDIDWGPNQWLGSVLLHITKVV